MYWEEIYTISEQFGVELLIMTQKTTNKKPDVYTFLGTQNFVRKDKVII